MMLQRWQAWKARPLSLRTRFMLATAAMVFLLSLAYGTVAVVGYAVSFDKTTYRLLRGESNLFLARPLARWTPDHHPSTQHGAEYADAGDDLRP